MPTIQESTHADLSGYAPVERGERKIGPQSLDLQPVINPMLRCPLPPLMNTPVDSLRQYYINGQIPQFRLLTPSSQTSGGGTTTIKTVSSTTTTSSGTASTSVSGIAAATAILTTPVLSVGQSYQALLAISKSFQLLAVIANAACRVELYGTKSAQISDLGRGLDIAPQPGTQQNLITDVVLDTAPYQFTFQNRCGANAESPQIGFAYITVTNTGVGSNAITVSFVYVPLETV